MTNPSVTVIAYIHKMCKKWGFLVSKAEYKSLVPIGFHTSQISNLGTPEKTKYTLLGSIPAPPP